MNHHTVKIYNVQDFEQITKGIKVAQCMKVKPSASDTENFVNNLEELVVSESLSCSFCNSIFKDKADQRLHYKLDWHRFNLKQRLHGLKPISEDSFNSLMCKDNNSSSMSKSECDSQSDGDYDSLDNRILLSLGAESTEDESEDEKIGGSLPDLSRHSKVFFENDEGHIFSLYRCLLHSKKEIPDADDQMIAQALGSGKKSLWTIIMVGGGHFAAAVFENGNPIVHKTVHCYTVRAKQGSSQSSRDNRANNTSKSGGANLRRHNENNLIQQVQDILESWSSHTARSSLIFYRAVGRFNRKVLFGGKNASFDKEDSRLRPLPFPTRRPTYTEVKRVYDILSNVEIYGLATDFPKGFPTSPNQCPRRKVGNKVNDQSLPTEEADNENIDNLNSNSDSPSNKTIPKNLEIKLKNGRTPIDRAKARKSPHRPLPDIVAALAYSSSDSELDSMELTANIELVHSDTEINFSRRLKGCEDKLPKDFKKGNCKLKTKAKRKGKVNDVQSANKDYNDTETPKFTTVSNSHRRKKKSYNDNDW